MPQKDVGMNWFVIVIGVLYFGAAIDSWVRAKPLWCALFVLFALADLLTAFIERRP
jgi:hypothetical protein